MKLKDLNLKDFIGELPDKNAEIVRAADIKIRPKDWVWEGHLLRGALELMSGIPGVGKSQAQIHYVACATNGLVWPNRAPAIAPMNVIMVTAEDALEQEVVPRLIAANADTDRVFILKAIRTDSKTKRQFLLAEDLEQLAKEMQRIGDVGLITIDPITAYMGGKMDSHKSTEVRSQLGPLKDFAENTNVAVSAVTHPAKNAGKRAIDYFIASQAFIAAARIGHVCIEEMQVDEQTGESQPTGRILYAHAKHSGSIKMPTLAYRIVGDVAVGSDNNTGEVIYSSRVVWDQEAVNISADAAIAAASGATKKRDAQVEAQNFLVQILADNQKHLATEIFEKGEGRGFSKKQLRTAAHRLNVVIEKQGERFDGPWEWQLVAVPF